MSANRPQKKRTPMQEFKHLVREERKKSYKLWVRTEGGLKGPGGSFMRVNWGSDDPRDVAHLLDHVVPIMRRANELSEKDIDSIHYHLTRHLRKVKKKREEKTKKPTPAEAYAEAMGGLR